MASFNATCEEHTVHGDRPRTEVSKQCIGRGAYGEVRKAKFKGLNCAGKRIHKTLQDPSDPGNVFLKERFLQECKILEQLRHPNIVQFLDTWDEEGHELPILIMEYLPLSLAKCIDGLNPQILPDALAYSILRDVALGLCYLHDQPEPIIHRDLSANNVLLTFDMTAKIADLGVARILNLSHVSKMSTTPGTLCYMPPEALESNPVYGTEIDIFSYGVLILYILSGSFPTPESSKIVIPNGPPVSRTEVQRREEYLKKVRHGHPLRGLLEKCLADHPSNRPKTYAVLEEVEKVRSKSPVDEAKNKIEALKIMDGVMSKLDKEKELAESTVVINHTSSFRKQSPALENESAVKLSSLHQSRQLMGKQVVNPALGSKLTKSAIEVNRMFSSLHQSSSCDLTPGTHPCQPATELMWTEKCDDLLFPLYEASAVVFEDAVYVGGGITSPQDKDNCIFRYGLEDKKWDTTVPPCPVKKFGLTTFNNKLVVVGGIATDSSKEYVSKEVYYIDKDLKRWEYDRRSYPQMPTPRHSFTAIGFHSNLITCGGVGIIRVLNTVEVFNLPSCTWCTMHPLPLPCYNMSYTIIQDTCYLLGGRNSERSHTSRVCYARLSSLCEAVPDATPNTTPWKWLKEIPDNSAVAANLNDCLVAVGGAPTPDLMRLSVRRKPSVSVFLHQAKSSWYTLRELPDPNACIKPAVAELSGGELLIIGGATSMKFVPQVTVYKGRVMNI